MAKLKRRWDRPDTRATRLARRGRKILLLGAAIALPLWLAWIWFDSSRVVVTLRNDTQVPVEFRVAGSPWVRGIAPETTDSTWFWLDSSTGVGVEIASPRSDEPVEVTIYVVPGDKLLLSWDGEMLKRPEWPN